MEPETPQEADLRQLKEALDDDALNRVENLVGGMHPAEIALALESLPPGKREAVWELVEDNEEGSVLAELNDEVRSGLLEGMNAAEVLAATEGMDLDDLADVVADLPDELTSEVIDSLDQSDRERLEVVLSYKEDTAGGLMNPDTVAVRRQLP